jgi:hypothetical protein
MCNVVADRMKVFTRPYVTILASAAGKPTDIGTGTFIEKGGVQLLSCQHVAIFNPTAFYIDDGGTSQLEPGIWCMEPNPNKDVAVALVSPEEWSHLSGSARPLPMSRFAQRHSTAEHELLFFRGIAGENAYISAFGTDVILSGYCSQEKEHTGDENIFEILWGGSETAVTAGTDNGVQGRVKYDDPAGFSGSLVWNTRFVDLGCDFSKWSPDKARVTGLLRRYDPNTDTLLVWRVEHLHEWL